MVAAASTKVAAFKAGVIAWQTIVFRGAESKKSRIPLGRRPSRLVVGNPAKDKQ
jgi:hypothetical protein